MVKFGRSRHTMWSWRLSFTKPPLTLLISIITSLRYWYTGLHRAHAAIGALRQEEQTAAIQGAVRRKEVEDWLCVLVCGCVWVVGPVDLWWCRKTSGGTGFYKTGVVAGVRFPNYARSPTAIRSCQQHEGTQLAAKEQQSTAIHPVCVCARFYIGIMGFDLNWLFSLPPMCSVAGPRHYHDEWHLS